MNWLLRISVILLSALALLVTTLSLAFIALPDRHISVLAVRITSALTGRELSIGSLSLTRKLTPELILTDVSLTNTDWAEHDNLFESQKINVSANLKSLLQGRLNIQSLTTLGLRLNLERNADDEPNWQFSENSSAQNLERIHLAHIDLIDSHVAYTDASDDRQHDVALHNVTLRTNSAFSPLMLEAAGVVDTLPVNLMLAMDSSTAADNVGDEDVDIRLDASVGKVSLDATGRFDPDEATTPVNIDGIARVESLAEIGSLIGTDLPALGPLELSVQLTGNPARLKTGGVDMPAFRLHLDDPLINLVIDGEVNDLHLHNDSSMNLALEVSDTDRLLDLARVDLALPGRLSANASLSGRDQQFNVDLHSATLESELIATTLSGTVTDLLQTASTSIDVNASLPDLSIVTALLGSKMRPYQSLPAQWGPVTANATVEGENGRYALNDIKATLDGNSKALATGRIDSLIPFDGMRLDAQAELLTLAEISSLTPEPLPEIGPMTGTGVVRWQDGRLTLEDARATHRSDYGTVVATGEIGDLIRFDKVRLRADADLPDLSILEPFTGIALPLVDKVVASANLISVDALNLSVRQLRATVTRDDLVVSGAGSVDSIFRGGPILDIALRSELDALDHLDSLLGVSLPAIGPLTATAQLSGTKDAISLSDVRATVSDEVLSGTISGLDDEPFHINEPIDDGLAFDVELNTPSVSDAVQRVGVTSAISKPAQLTGSVRVNGDMLSIADARLTIGDNRLHGDIVLRHLADAKRRTALDADISVVELDLLDLYNRPLGIQGTGALSPDNDKSDDNPLANRKLLSDIRMPFAQIAKEDIRLTLDIRELRSAFLDVSDASLQVEANDGVIAIGPIAGVINEGQALLDLTIDTTVTPPAIALDVSLDEIDLSRAGWLEGSDLITNSGGTWLRLSLNGSGASLAELMASASGEGGIYIENLLFEENALSLFSSDLLDQLADALNLFEKRAKQTQLDCTVATFQIENGVLNTPYGLAVDSKDFVVVGDADLDFRNEKLEVEFDTRPKRGLGIGLNRVTNLVKLDGTLANPSLSFSSEGILEFGASLAAAIASGGATLLAEGLYEKTRANSDVCKKALGQ